MSSSSSDSNNSKRKKGDLDNPGQDEEEDASKYIEVSMPGAEPKKDDAYFCTAFNVTRLTNGRVVYVTEFVANAHADRAHHVILQKCEGEPKAKEGEIW